MEAVPQIGPGSTRGRKDGQQEAAIKLGAVRDKMQGVVNLLTIESDAKESASRAIKMLAEETGLQAKIIRSAARAMLSDKVEERRRDWAQGTLLLEEI